MKSDDRGNVGVHHHYFRYNITVDADNMGYAKVYFLSSQMDL